MNKFEHVSSRELGSGGSLYSENPISMVWVDGSLYSEVPYLEVGRWIPVE